MRLHGFRYHALQFGDLRLDHIQPLQIELQQLSVQRLRPSVEGIRQFRIRSVQSPIAQFSQPCRIRFAGCDRAQHTSSTGSQQITDHAGQI